jgi:peptidoglycan/LPS O-acetylase OafA/YrhL
MKKSLLVIIISVLVIAAILLLIFKIKTSVGIPEILPLGIILLVAGFGLFFGITRLQSAKRGEPVEDEMSKNILKKASSSSFYISLYMWLVVMYLSDKTQLENHSLIGAGIIGMAFIFCVCWIFHKTWGIKNV